jgi:hypothetical protein
VSKGLLSLQVQIRAKCDGGRRREEGGSQITECRACFAAKKLNTEIGLHTTHHHKLFDSFQAT